MNNYNTFYELKDSKVHFVKDDDFVYPHIAVNIGSGVSILIVKSNTDIKRETGTLIGGGKQCSNCRNSLGISQNLDRN